MSKFIGFCICITLGLGFITAGTILCPIFMGLSLIQICLISLIKGDEITE